MAQHLTRYDVRNLTSDDFETLCQLEADIFGAAGYTVVGPHYLRVCTELFADTGLIAFDGSQPIGYLLSFVRDREAYCTRLGVRAELQGTKAATLLVAAFVTTLIERDFDLCWFTVKPDNLHARAFYARLGAVECGTRRGFLSPDDELILQRVDKSALAAIHRRLGPVHPARPAAASSAAAVSAIDA